MLLAIPQTSQTCQKTFVLSSYQKNTTALLKLMDQGIIAAFKAYYLRRTFKKMIEAVETDKSLSIIQFWKQFEG